MNHSIPNSSLEAKALPFCHHVEPHLRPPSHCSVCSQPLSPAQSPAANTFKNPRFYHCLHGKQRCLCREHTSVAACVELHQECCRVSTASLRWRCSHPTPLSKEQPARVGVGGRKQVSACIPCQVRLMSSLPSSWAKLSLPWEKHLAYTIRNSSSSHNLLALPSSHELQHS